MVTMRVKLFTCSIARIFSCVFFFFLDYIIEVGVTSFSDSEATYSCIFFFAFVVGSIFSAVFG